MRAHDERGQHSDPYGADEEYELDGLDEPDGLDERDDHDASEAYDGSDEAEWGGPGGGGGAAGSGAGQRAQGRAERVFAALPPAQGRSFAQTWWGRAWLQALEDTALDNQQLKKGRKQARAGAVGAVSVRPGRITAVVRGNDGTPYRSDVLLRELTDAEWDRFLDVVADQVGHIAALLDRDMPPHLVEDAAAAGVELLPGIGDLEPECACEAWDHCPHTAALCYQLARLLDQDPFVLLLMRGRGEREVLDDLQERTAERAAPRAAERTDIPLTPATLPAREVFASAVAVAPLPAPVPPVAEPGRPPRLRDGAAEAADGAVPQGTADEGEPVPDPEALEFLAADAAVRAQQLLAQASAPGHAEAPVPAELSVWQDAVRLAAAGPSEQITARLLAGSGRDRATLDRAVRAWRYGGREALSVLDEPWSPDPDTLARAGAQLARAWDEEPEPPRLRAEGNRWTSEDGRAQLRYGRDGRWWPFRAEADQWSPAGPASTDPATALAGVLDE
ncbi:SWF or SNF family helicase [Streptomyces sp. 796.1]|uniref:SWF or SNF family helicase n=1 Tax=Streptomyces sp. 796.1 TaxID=3163029 RepID=UPI0039C99BBF